MYRLTARDMEAKWGTSVFARFPAEDAAAAIEESYVTLRAWEKQGWVFLYATLWYDSIMGLRIRVMQPEDWRIKEQSDD